MLHLMHIVHPAAVLLQHCVDQVDQFLLRLRLLLLVVDTLIYHVLQHESQIPDQFLLRQFPAVGRRCRIFPHDQQVRVGLVEVADEQVFQHKGGVLPGGQLAEVEVDDFGADNKSLLLAGVDVVVEQFPAWRKGYMRVKDLGAVRSLRLLRSCESWALLLLYLSVLSCAFSWGLSLRGESRFDFRQLISSVQILFVLVAISRYNYIMFACIRLISSLSLRFWPLSNSNSATSFSIRFSSSACTSPSKPVSLRLLQRQLLEDCASDRFSMSQFSRFSISCMRFWLVLVISSLESMSEERSCSRQFFSWASSLASSRSLPSSSSFTFRPNCCFSRYCSICTRRAESSRSTTSMKSLRVGSSIWASFCCWRSSWRSSMVRVRCWLERVRVAFFSWRSASLRARMDSLRLRRLSSWARMCSSSSKGESSGSSCSLEDFSFWLQSLIFISCSSPGLLPHCPSSTSIYYCSNKMIFVEQTDLHHFPIRNRPNSFFPSSPPRPSSPRALYFSLSAYSSFYLRLHCLRWSKTASSVILSTFQMLLRLVSYLSSIVFSRLSRESTASSIVSTFSSTKADMLFSKFSEVSSLGFFLSSSMILWIQLNESASAIRQIGAGCIFCMLLLISYKMRLLISIISLSSFSNCSRIMSCRSWRTSSMSVFRSVGVVGMGARRERRGARNRGSASSCSLIAARWLLSMSILLRIYRQLNNQTLCLERKVSRMQTSSSSRVRIWASLLVLRVLIFMFLRSPLACSPMNWQMSASDWGDSVSCYSGFEVSLIKMRIILRSSGLIQPLGSNLTQFFSFKLFLANICCFQSIFLLNISTIVQKLSGNIKIRWGLSFTVKPQRSRSSQLLSLPQLRVGFSPAAMSLVDLIRTKGDLL